MNIHVGRETAARPSSSASKELTCCSDSNSKHPLQPFAAPLSIQIDRIPQTMDGKEELGKKKGKEILQENLLPLAVPLHSMVPIPLSTES
jgi:hypothetical protein